MDKDEFDKKLQRRIAQLSVGASALRNQGGSGLVETCRNYFEKKIDLQNFFSALKEKDEYSLFLDNHTNELLKLFPKEAKSWGAARKGLNLFLRDICYNKYFADKFNLPKDYSDNNRMLKYLEVPLDKDVAKGLIRSFPKKLPKWDRIKNLTKETSDQFQEKANLLATEKGVARVHLDLLFWRENK
ncbi:hypothetical protein E4S40_06155 [Algoriphagus kandeliae]|uniref:Uncharacterized protein n=1 Tax=Algoriphagus kandeliae TaxID=2562278 RepID=A0A4Y9QX35_9BACT|nr:hypothetical protein [Algoriphagus kandeliae]TFV95803.1 hypothetical protein E4S40_06155 [Algoriphagus kandeliae]